MSGFPAIPYPAAAEFFSGYGDEASRAWKTIDPAAVRRAAAVLLDAYRTGARVFSCGNGGSASVANHLACDHVKGVRTGTGLFSKVISLSSNVELLTAIANDISYEDVFAYQLQSLGSEGDVLIAVSSAGKSVNICEAIWQAQSMGMRTIALTGFSGGPAREMANTAIHVDCDNYGIVEDMHQAIMHALAQYIRQSQIEQDSIASTVF